MPVCASQSPIANPAKDVRALQITGAVFSAASYFFSRSLIAPKGGQLVGCALSGSGAGSGGAAALARAGDRKQRSARLHVRCGLRSMRLGAGDACRQDAAPAGAKRQSADDMSTDWSQGWDLPVLSWLWARAATWRATSPG